MQDVQAIDARSRFSLAVVAGLCAGLAGAATAVAAELALSVRFPLPADTALSSFVARMGGGLVYGKRHKALRHRAKMRGAEAGR